MREKRYRERNPMPLSDACNRRLFSTRTFFLILPSPHTHEGVFSFRYFLFFLSTRSLTKGTPTVFFLSAARPSLYRTAPKTFSLHRYACLLYTTFYFNFIFYEYFETVLFSWLAPVTTAASVCKERINCSHFL